MRVFSNSMALRCSVALSLYWPFAEEETEVTSSERQGGTEEVYGYPEQGQKTKQFPAGVAERLQCCQMSLFQNPARPRAMIENEASPTPLTPPPADHRRRRRQESVVVSLQESCQMTQHKKCNLQSMPKKLGEEIICLL